MLVRSRVGTPLKYRKSSGCYVIQPNTVTFIEDGKVTAKELKGTYGDRIEIISEDLVAPVTEEKKEVKLEERKEDLTDKSLEGILAQVKEEIKEDGTPEENKEAEDKTSEENKELEGGCDGECKLPAKENKEVKTPAKEDKKVTDKKGTAKASKKGGFGKKSTKK